jgi:hypothetical protein
MVVLLVAAGLIGAAAGGGVGYLTGGLTGAALGAGVGALAGVGSFAVGYALAGHGYWNLAPFPGSWCPYYLYPGSPRLYYTTAY